MSCENRSDSDSRKSALYEKSKMTEQEETKENSENDKSKGHDIQKKQLKKSYAIAYRDGMKHKKGAAPGKASDASNSAKEAAKAVRDKAKDAVTDFVKNHAGAIAIFLVVILLGIIILNSIGVVGGIVLESGEAFTKSTYLSSDEDILETDEKYKAYEEELQKQVDNIESSYPGYDEYRYQVDEMTHDSYALTSYLTAMYGNFKYEDIKDDLIALFREQYVLKLEESTETKTRTYTDEDGEKQSETYEWHVLNVKLTNKGLDAIAKEHLNNQQLSLYNIYQASLGNRSYLFGDEITAGNPAEGGMKYDIPPEALEDAEFAGMIEEAEKYLGMAYVWGGSSPATGFDCSGFVSWVINNSGNGWDIGRCTANGLRSHCTYVSPSEVKPGVLIFFEKTYNASGATHVGIYVGDGMMIHCGDPIQYTSINSNYWQEHFLSFGRISD